MHRLILIFCFLSSSYYLHAQTDLSQLHAPPTLSEINAVKSEWSTRDYNAYNWTILHTGTLGIFRVDIISHEVNGNKHYAAVRYPENYSPTGSYPVLVSNHGGASGVNVNSLNAYQSDCFKSFFVALPSFRSEELRTTPIATTDYTSEGTPSEMDGDTDDALALLSGVLAIPGADGNRIAVTGGSRGGGVSHLMAAKDSRIDRVSVFYGATDHMALPGLQQEMENYVDFGGGLNPPETNTYTYGVAPYLNGDITLAEAREILLRRSVLYFVDQLPLPYQVHHGDIDPVVTVNHSQVLAAEFANQSIGSPNFEYFEYAGERHSLPISTGAPASRDAFLCQLSNLNFAVEILAFDAVCHNDEKINISFEVQVDSNTKYIDIEWSNNNQDWKTIQTYTLNPTTDFYFKTQYEHDNSLSQENFYRLKITEQSEVKQYSNTLELNCGHNESVDINPNPTSGFLTIRTNTSNTTELGFVKIFSLQGQEIIHLPFDTNEIVNIDTTILAKGSYICQVYSNGNWYSKKIVKL